MGIVVGGRERHLLQYFARYAILEESAVNKTLLKGVGVAVGAGCIAAFAYAASAQDKKLMPPEKMPAEKWAACGSLKNEAACKAGKNCSWLAEEKDDKGKVKRNGHCRSNPNSQKDDLKKN